MVIVERASVRDNWVLCCFNVFHGADNVHSPRKQLILSDSVWLPLGDRTNQCWLDSHYLAKDLAWAGLACASPATSNQDWTKKLLRWVRRDKETEDYYSRKLFFPFMWWMMLQNISWIFNKHALTVSISNCLRGIFNKPSFSLMEKCFILCLLGFDVLSDFERVLIE